jgi:ABC-type sugar transport system substrate-binding protein
MKQKRRTSGVAAVLTAAIAVAIAGCGQQSSQAAGAGGRSGGEVPAGSNENYYWISQDTTLPLFVKNDLVALKLVGKQLGVNVHVAGPTGINLSQLISTINQVCAQHPAGVDVVGWDPSEDAAVNQCMQEGVPVVTDDADLPNSKRLAFVGTDWNEIGVAEANAIIRATGGQGEIATTSIYNAPNMRAARAGFMATIAGTGLKVVANENDNGLETDAAMVTHNLLAAHPNLVAIAGFDAESGSGISTALREAGKTARVKVVTVEQTPAYFKNLQTGAVSAIVIQKRELFTYYGIKLLVDYNHSGLTVDGLGTKYASPIPENLNTGLVTVTKSTPSAVIAALAKQ